MGRPRLFDHVLSPAERAARYRAKRRLIERPWLAWRVPFAPSRSKKPAVTKLSARELAETLIA
jgi:hypothetical protein